MRGRQFWVCLVHGTVRGPLVLKRAPLLLRFVLTGADWKTLDALDQPGDEPKPGERVIAAERRGGFGSVHVDGRDRKGRRTAEWYTTADYESVPDQPPQEVLRDRAEWEAWCWQRVGKTPPQPA